MNLVLIVFAYLCCRSIACDVPPRLFLIYSYRKISGKMILAMIVGKRGRKQKNSDLRTSPGPLWRLHTWFDLFRYRLVAQRGDDRRCRSPQLGFTTSQPRGCIPSSAPQTALREAVEQSLVRCRGQPFGRTFETRTVTRTALREDLRNSDGHTDSPSGGTHELRPKLRSLYRVAHIQCHLSGRASPSRTSSHRNPDSLSALRNYFPGREREDRSCMALVCEKG